MRDIELVLGDATFTVSVWSRSQNNLNTAVNLPHFHIDNELHIVLSGAVTMNMDDRDVPITVGDAYIVPPNVSHFYKDYTANFNKISCLFTISRNREAGNGFSEYEYYSKVLGELTECVMVNDDNILRIAEEIYELQYSEATEHIYKSLYSILLILVTKLVYKKLYSENADPFLTEYVYKDTDEQKKVIEQFFQMRYGESITVEDLAHSLYRSVPQTHRIVKKYFGDSFKKILTRQRMERALIMIRENESTFSDIAAACGYDSYGGFLSAFKKYVGKTPEECKSQSKE